MVTVKILPEVLSNKIAAGEVVERPASVVKELVENSIDAKADDITIEVEKSGKNLIRVSDNGTGLSRDDALLAIERYATSKISTQEDLFSIATMGFRGEALPSIASVSKFTIVSKTKDTDAGTRIAISGGRLQDVSDTGAPVGTMIEVRQLFYNVPARKKFLKTDQTEIGHIADTINGLALGHPEIRFRLFSNKTLFKNYPASDNPLQRAVSVLGNEVSKKLNEIHYTDEKFVIRGYCADPAIVRGSSSKIYIFVNQRLIYNRGLISAIFQGYRGRIMKGKYPLLVLYIDIDAGEVDVNVHPAKREVRFYDARKIYEAVSLAISNSLIQNLKADQNQGSPNNQHYDNQQPESQHPDKRPFVFNIQDTDKKKIKFPDMLDPEDRMEGISQPYTPQKYQQESLNFEQKSEPASELSKIEESVKSWDISISDQPGRYAHKNESIEDPFFLKKDVPEILGQVMGTYIVAESDAGLLLIDQHAAHERIIYEDLKQKISSSELRAQGLLIPETVEFNHRESAALQDMIPELALLGIIVEPFGGTTFVIKAVPSIISGKDIKSILIDIIEKTLAEKDSFRKDRWLDECIILMSCKKAVKANHRMNTAEMQDLLEKLEKCKTPGHCPHGRPIMIVISRKELEKRFKRVV